MHALLRYRDKAYVWAPMLFAFALVMGLAPRLEKRERATAQLCIQTGSQAGQNGSRKAQAKPGLRLAAQGPSAAPEPKLSVPVGDYAQQLPASLRRAIPGPALHVGSGSWKRARSSRPARRSSKAARSHSQRAGSLRLRRISKRAQRLEYRLGARVTPEQIRINSRSELRIVMKLGPAARRALEGTALDRPGVSVRAIGIGQERISLRIKSEANWTIGALKRSDTGWSLMIRANPNPEEALP